MALNDPAIEHFYSLRPRDYPTILRFELRQEGLDIDATPDVILKIELAPQGGLGEFHLLLSFYGVRSLRYTPLFWGELHLPLIEIRSIQAQQWEGLYYSVQEPENDTLAFYCRRFNAEIIAD